MAEPYLAEIRVFGFNFAPLGWALCNGQLMSISQNAALFDVIGTTYGGDGVNTFALPNLQSRIPAHQGDGQVLGSLSGSETVELTLQEISAHAHTAMCTSSLGTLASPSGKFWAQDNNGNA